MTITVALRYEVVPAAASWSLPNTNAFAPPIASGTIKQDFQDYSNIDSDGYLSQIITIPQPTNPSSYLMLCLELLNGPAAWLVSFGGPGSAPKPPPLKLTATDAVPCAFVAPGGGRFQGRTVRLVSPGMQFMARPIYDLYGGGI